VFSIGLLSNSFLIAGIAFEVALLVALVFVGPLQGVFHMRPLDPLAWPFLLIWPVFVLGGEELRKAVCRRYVWRDRMRILNRRRRAARAPPRH
jgi:P-type Ca2+ transporter type 2C